MLTIYVSYQTIYGGKCGIAKIAHESLSVDATIGKYRDYCCTLRERYNVHTEFSIYGEDGKLIYEE